MALTLKLKAPSGNSQSGVDASAKSSTTSASNAQRIPKIRIKPPSVESPKRAKSSSESKQKKLKISLGKNSTPIAPPRPVRNVPRVRVKPTRIPGEGYDSEAPGIEDDMLLEQGIAVRFLDDSNLDIVQQAVSSGDLSAVNLKWITREKAVFNINGTFYSARLVDLPTVTELYKTMDKKNIFKTMDVCQLLLVLKAINPAELDTDKDFEVPPEYTYVHPLYKLLSKGEIKQRHTLVRDGLTSPFVNVLRRFRPRKTTHRVLEDIDARVRELIKLDDEAEESHFEVVDESAINSRFTAARPSPGPTAMSNSQAPSMDSRIDSIGAAEHAFGTDRLGGDGEDPDDDDIETHLEEELNEVFGDEDEDEIEDGLSAVMEGGEIAEDDEEEDDDDEDDEDEDEDEDDDESKAERQHAKLLENEIAELEKVVEYHKKNLSNATSKMMRMKFQNTYSSLKASLDQKKRTLAKHQDEQDQLMKMQDPGNMHTQRLEAYEEEEDDDDDDDEEEEVEEEDPERNNEEQDADIHDQTADEPTEKLDDLDDLF